MKKFFAIAAIAGTLVACNNSSENANAADSTATTVDTTAVAPADSTAVAPADSTAVAPAVDSAAATTGAAADSAK